MNRRVCYVHSDELTDACDALPSNVGRARLVHSLISSFDLLDSPCEDDGDDRARCSVVTSVPATRAQLIAFHDARYVDALLGTKNTGSEDESTTSDSDEEHEEEPPRKRRKATTSFGLVDDCPPFSELPSYAVQVAGASMTAARELREGRSDVAIAWTGGRHHGKRGEAAGFCYVQDVVLAISELRRPPTRSSSKQTTTADSGEDDAAQPPPRKRLKRCLYLDLDLHHGDGVEAAYHGVSDVLTLSIHLHAPGFFPASGTLESHGGHGGAAYHSLNAALEPGLSSKNLLRIFDSCVGPIVQAFEPDAVVVQCGCDGLAGDPCREWNLDLKGFGQVLDKVLEWKLPTLLLGGGGYDSPNAARCWAYLTSVALGRPLDLEASVPVGLDDYAKFGPSFTLDVTAGHRRDENTQETLSRVETVFAEYAKQLRLRCHP